MSVHLQPAEQPVTESDAFIAEALEHASIPTLMMSMIHMSGDPRLLDGTIHPRTVVMGEVQGFMDEAEKAEIRRRALEVVKAYRDRGCTLPPPPTPEMIHRMMSFMVGEHVPGEYVPMMLEEMALDGEDRRAPHWGNEVPESVRKNFHVVVIGAGMSGLLMAIRLQEAGIPFTVIEKNDAVGGTWYENTYPGCRVDIANHFYSYSFEPNHEWPEYFSRRNELFEYFKNCADKYGVTPHIRFETEVVSAEYREQKADWSVVIRDASGKEETLVCNALVSAVGQLNRPNAPDIAGLNLFKGACFHSATWEHQHDLSGRRVAVIGTGASAFQLVPEVAKIAEKLLVFQRSPVWMFPNPIYHDFVDDKKKWLLKHLPYYGRWYRFLLFWPGSDGLLPSLKIDPDWPHQDRSVNARNEEMRRIFSDYMLSQLTRKPELADKVIPKYPPFGKRMLQDNGSWLAALQKDNVELVTEGIDRITEDAVITQSGERYSVDFIVFAAGFKAGQFLWPMRVEGREGKILNEEWGDDPQAYLGITAPDFPNLFCLYGPGTNLAHAGSIIFHSECQVRYVMACLKTLLEHGYRAMEVKPSVNAEFNQKLQQTLQGMVWSHSGMHSWYKNSQGRVVTTSPWRLVDYWRWTREPRLSDYQWQ